MVDLISLFILVIMALGAMAVFTLIERNLLGMAQLRKGPQKVGVWGLLQPLADALKLLSKGSILPLKANWTPYYWSPIASLVIIMVGWGVMPTYYSFVWFKYGGIIFLCVSSLSVYPVMISGWASNSKYSLLGAIRSIAQTISYEVSMSFVFMSLAMIYFSMNLTTLLSSQYLVFFMVPVISSMWLVTCLAEANRSPFDLAEGESELVSGFNTEYASWGFTMIFMAEYMAIILLSLVSYVLTMPSLIPRSLGIVMVSGWFLMVRASMPRQRYDKLMHMTWTCYLPVSMWGLIIVLSVV